MQELLSLECVNDQTFRIEYYDFTIILIKRKYGKNKIKTICLLAVIARAAQYLKGFAPDASLTMIGLAAPCATVFGIVINLLDFVKLTKKDDYS